MNKTYLYLIISIVVIIFGVLIALVVVASRSAAPKKEAGAGRTEITIWRPIDDPEIFDEIIAKYEEQRPEIKINYLKKPAESYELDSLSAIAAGQGPDIWSIPNSWMARHQDKLSAVPQGALAETKDQSQKPEINSQAVRQSFAPVVAEEVIFDNQVYGLPLSVDTLALVANADILEQKLRQFSKETAERTLLEQGPVDWNEFIQLVKLLTEKTGSTLTRPGAALGTSDNISNSADILAALMLQNNTAMNSIDRSQATFNLPVTKASGETFYPGQSALDFYTKFSSPSQEVYTWNVDQPNDLELFSQGKLAAVFAYAYQVKQIINRYPDLKIASAPFPQIKGSTAAIDFASYWVETVPSSSKHQGEAWNFVLYVLQNGLGSYLAKADRPAPAAVTQLPEITQRIKEDNPWKFQAQTAQSWYQGPEPAKVIQSFKQMIKAVNQGQSLQNAIDQAAAQITASFRK